MLRFQCLALAAVVLSATFTASAVRSQRSLKQWDFSRDSLKWDKVIIPHDWAIYGPFDRNNDLQKVTVEQNGETEATWKTGRTGGLPYVGKGYYKNTFELADTTGLSTDLLFDGAMSHARVYVNGKKVAYWPYGYNSFYVNLDGVVRPGVNTVEVSLENPPESSRWYPGAGLYRNVHLLQTDRVHIPVWGTYLTTPQVSKDYATVRLVTEVSGVEKRGKVNLKTEIKDPQGRTVATAQGDFYAYPGVPFTQNLRVERPDLWSPENPALYTAETTVSRDGRVCDTYSTRFGIRSIEYVAGDGFYLNGVKTKFRGVNNHHDLGPLGAAVNRSALRHQREIMKDMGVNAIRTSHNMPAPELVELADEMGFMLMIEPFDDWGFRPKCKNGYGTLFNDWAEKDVVNMVRHFRNSPSVVMWSIGNEVPSQWWEDGLSELKMLQDIVHREDPTRPVTCGMDQLDAVVNNGFAAALDIPSFNYKTNRYHEIMDKLPQDFVLGSETASTVSSRGQYFFPVKKGSSMMHPGNQSNSYDVEYCDWSNIPDDDFVQDDDRANNLGQFVWTGFDYLGEPSPYDTDAWPSHVSVFGIVDLASIPKDRYYLYRSQWNKDDHTLHILPHWNWEGREGEVTPVFVYTDYPKAELFINGKSQGVREKNDSTNMNRYRLMWMETVYEPGEVKVVAYDDKGNAVAEKMMRTAGKPDHIVLTPSRKELSADGEDLVYITVQVADKDGNIVPTDTRRVKFSAKGAGKFRATANGDPTNLDLFHLPEMPLFAGAATAIVQAGDKPGTVTFEAKAPGVKGAKITIPVK
ncbi:MAG: glycoside hydrolase family 2 TIM barrel-domain containing protein [Porphyromonadaceae bacterium]|nr:glycoside hydrolase family 2 TIM barrel-domain containing protein [Porphyromonadaceae bacterium]